MVLIFLGDGPNSAPRRLISGGGTVVPMEEWVNIEYSVDLTDGDSSEIGYYINGDLCKTESVTG
jgi:hypothetical protein